MIDVSNNFFDVESVSDFNLNRFSRRIIDPCNPPIRMFIDDNNLFTPSVAADVRVIKRVSFKKCKKHRHHHEDDCGDVSPDVGQTHVHEVQGSVEIAEPQEDPHNHRFATVSGPAIFFANGDHYHEVRFRTDFYEEHYHQAWGRTGGAIQVGDRHVHFLSGVTTVDDGHLHNYRVATLIEDPTS